MSLVGTRPILQDELQKYELHHRARIAIKPGITGMWQVSGRSDIRCRINADDTQADKAEVFYTRCLKEFPFFPIRRSLQRCRRVSAK